MEINRKSKYVTLDFLRSLSILLMVIVHFLNRVYDDAWFENELLLQEKPIFLLYIFSQVIFFGAWAGFFLLISATGNMIKMQKQLKHGISQKTILLEQLLKGVILLFFAMLIESITGYKGFIGEKLFQSNKTFLEFLGRMMHCETIHTIAYCIIANSIVQYVISKRVDLGQEQGRRKAIIYYIILAVIVLALTQPLWELVKVIIPGYPDTKYEGIKTRVQYPIFGESTIWEILLRFMVLPIAGQPEPIFPFLAISFIGSILGIWLSEERPSKQFLNKGLWVSLFVMLFGFLIVIITIATGIQNPSKLIKYAYKVTALDGWYGWFLFMSPIHVFFFLTMFRLVEFRGSAANFAKYTRYIRKYGTIPLTVYNLQFLDFIILIIATLLSGFNAIEDKFTGIWIWILLFGYLLLWSLVLWVWEKLYYVGTFEWCSALITNKRRKTKEPSEQDKDFTKIRPRLDFMNISESEQKIQWINLDPDENHRNFESVTPENEKSAGIQKINKFFSKLAKESKVQLLLSLIGIISPVYAVLAWVDFTIKSNKQDLRHKKNLQIINLITAVGWGLFALLSSVIKIGIFF